jgi:hypothetical protein
MNTDKNAAMRPSDASIAKAVRDAYEKKHHRAAACLLAGLMERARELDAARPAQAGEAVKPWERFDDDLENHVRAATPEETAAIHAAISHPQPEQPASAVDDDELDGGCSTCNGLGLANVIDPSDGALVMNDCPECGGESYAQSPAVSPPSVVACSKCAELENSYDRELANVDKIIAKIGIPLDRARTDGGSLHVPRILNHIQETLDALVQATNSAGHFHDELCKLRETHRTALESFAQRMAGSGERDAKRIDWLEQAILSSLSDDMDVTFCRPLNHGGASSTILITLSSAGKSEFLEAEGITLREAIDAAIAQQNKRGGA